MTGLALVLAHLVGDYIVQNDWMATWKGADAGKTTDEEDAAVLASHGDGRHAALDRIESVAYWRPSLACFAHCTAYTLAVWAFTFAWMPWWGLLACWLLHWPLDRYRLARWWMDNASGQKAFAAGPLAPWSIIVVDNTFHLLVLFLIAKAAGVA